MLERLFVLAAMLVLGIMIFRGLYKYPREVANPGGLMMLNISPCPIKGCGSRRGIALEGGLAKCADCGKVRPYTLNIRTGHYPPINLTAEQAEELIASGLNTAVLDRIIQENLRQKEQDVGDEL